MRIPAFERSHARLLIRTAGCIGSSTVAEFNVFCVGIARPPSRGHQNKHMSRIFDAIKHAEMVRSGKLTPNSPGEGAVEVPDRRRSRRWSLDIPVYVYGHGPSKEPFHEEAHTLHVNANGALLLLSVPIRTGQKLLLTNTLTQQEQDCRVVFLGTKRSRTVEAGVEFPLTNPDFWQLPTRTKHDSGI
jgi:hypothetical protein